MKKEKKFDKRIFKKTGDELQAYLAFKRRGSATKSKKAKALMTAKNSREVKTNEKGIHNH